MPVAAATADLNARRDRHRGRRRREKTFGEGRLVPLDREAKVRIAALARSLMHRTEPGKAYGVLTAKFVAVLNALLWGFHNAASGRCFPSYEAIAEKAACARSTVYEAVHALEAAGILSWVNRIKKVREWGPDLFGRALNRWRVVRTSNAYTFADPKQPARPPDSSKSEIKTGTQNQGFTLACPAASKPGKLPKLVLTTSEEAALARLGALGRTT